MKLYPKDIFILELEAIDIELLDSALKHYKSINQLPAYTEYRIVKQLKVIEEMKERYTEYFESVANKTFTDIVEAVIRTQSWNQVRYALHKANVATIVSKKELTLEHLNWISENAEKIHTFGKLARQDVNGVFDQLKLFNKRVNEAPKG